MEHKIPRHEMASRFPERQLAQASVSSRHRACTDLGRRAAQKIMIRKIEGGYRSYSRKKNLKTGERKNLGTFKTLAAAKKHERAVQYFKRN